MRQLLENVKDADSTNLSRSNPAFLSTVNLLGRQLVEKSLA